MYVAIDRKMDNGVEIHNSACGRSGIMIRLGIVKSARHESEQEDDEYNLPHGTHVLKELAPPWANTDRMVCTDSYFASVPTAEELWKHGLSFNGLIKTAMRQFMVAYLSNIEFQNRGDMSGLLTRPVDMTKLVLGAFIWMIQNRRYFIFTGVLMEKEQLYTRIRWRQENPDPNTDPNMVYLTIPYPIIEDIYYSAFGKINRRNKCRQESLDIKKVGY